LSDIGSVGLDGDIGEDALSVHVAAADVMGDVGDCEAAPIAAVLGLVETAHSFLVPADPAVVYSMERRDAWSGSPHVCTTEPPMASWPSLRET
jgi:hypothetical protein